MPLIIPDITPELTNPPVHIPGGHLATPYVCGTSHTEYILDGDITADTTAFEIKKDYIAINLNGFTITYNILDSGAGVWINEWNLNDICVHNGEIHQSDNGVGGLVMVNLITEEDGGGSYQGDPGIDYTVGDILTLVSDNVGSGGTIRVDSVGPLGEVLTVSIQDPGTLYEETIYARSLIGFKGSCSGGTGTGCRVNVEYAKGEGAVYGDGCNLVRSRGGMYPYTSGFGMSAHRVQVCDIVGSVCGRDTGLIFLEGYSQKIEQCNLTDRYQWGSIKNRDQGIKAIYSSSTPSSRPHTIVRNNVITDARQIGISSGSKAFIYDNEINVRSLITNASAVSCGSDSEVYNNNIHCRGALGIGVYVGGHDSRVHHNTIDVQTTMIGAEYQYGAKSIGIRSMYGAAGSGMDNYEIDNNTITVTTDYHYTDGYWAESGEPIAEMTSQGKGMMFGMSDDQVADVHHNTITVTDADGDAHISTCVTFTCKTVWKMPGMLFRENICYSDLYHFWPGDSYSASIGFPMVRDNRFIRTKNYPRYYTFGSDSGTYPHEVRLVDNIYEGGASADSISFPGTSKNIEMFFGHAVGSEEVYDYRMHNNDGEDSNTLTKEIYDPAIEFPYPLPVDPDEPEGCPIGGNSSFANIGDGNSSVIVKGTATPPPPVMKYVGWNSGVESVPTSNSSGEGHQFRRFTASSDGTVKSVDAYIYLSVSPDTESVAVYRDVAGTITLVGKAPITGADTTWTGNVDIIAEAGQTLDFNSGDDIYYGVVAHDSGDVYKVGREDEGGTDGGLWHNSEEAPSGPASTITLTSSPDRDMAFILGYE